jgi:exosortase
MSFVSRWVDVGVLVGAGLLLFAPTLTDLAGDWLRDDNYSHGFLIAPAAAWMIWERRLSLSGATVRPHSGGIAILCCGLALYVLGSLGAESFVTRASLIAVVAGTVVFVLGWRFLRLVAFPLAFLLLMIPLPAIIFNRIAFPLQLLASQLGVWALRAWQIPVLREGNVLVLSNTTLEVAQACSGIRSLISLLTISLLLGYVARRSGARRFTLALCTIPIAIFANAARVAAAGVTAAYYGPEAVEGLLHSLSGWVTFTAAVVLLLGADKAMGAFSRLVDRTWIAGPVRA